MRHAVSITQIPDSRALTNHYAPSTALQRSQPAPIAAAHQLADQGSDGLTQKDVKNEDSSGWFVENKGAKKVLLRVY